MAEEKKESQSKSTRSPKKTTSKEEPSHTIKRLYRSKTNRYIGGVCGGVAEYFNLDPTLVRVLWVLSAFLNGFGVIAYIASWIIIPENPNNSQETTKVESRSKNTSVIVGTILICFGLIFLFNQMHWFDYYPFGWDFRWRWHRWFDFDVLLPLVIIIIGVVYLVNVLKKEKREKP